jgi:N-acyl-D-amino-acid deacylase
LFDTIIRGGKVIDGTGAPWFYADLGIVGDRIVAVARNLYGDAKRVIDATGKFVCPGFIDIHTHTDTAILRAPERLPKVTQGVATEVFSNCGLGVAPLNEAGREALLNYGGKDFAGLDFDWLRVSEYLNKIPPAGVNTAYLIPHGALRVSAMGYAARPATEAEIDIMRLLAKEGMEDGAFGMSTGLAYVPMSSSVTEEVTRISDVVSRHGGFLASHLRNYREGIKDSIDEMVTVAKETGIPVQVSHYAASGDYHKGHGKQFLQYITDARQQGCDLTYDSYPYEYSGGRLRNTIPAKYHDGGIDGLVRCLKDPTLRYALKREVGVLTNYDLTKLMIISVANPGLEHLLGKRLSEGAKEAGKDILAFLCDTLAEDPHVGHANFVGNTEEMRILAASPYQMVGSDSSDVSPGRNKAHPRLYGTFPRFIRMYVKETALMSWEQAIWKMTGFPACRMGLSFRGHLRPGFYADIVVVDPDEITDRASLESPELTCLGIDYVLVNGVLEFAEGVTSGDLGGIVLRKGSA